MIKLLTINQIVLAKDHAELQCDGYSADQTPAEYSYAHFKIPLEDVGLYKVGELMKFTMEHEYTVFDKLSDEAVSQ